MTTTTTTTATTYESSGNETETQELIARSTERDGVMRKNENGKYGQLLHI